MSEADIAATAARADERAGVAECQRTAQLERGRADGRARVTERERTAQLERERADERACVAEREQTAQLERGRADGRACAAEREHERVRASKRARVTIGARVTESARERVGGERVAEHEYGQAYSSVISGESAQAEYKRAGLAASDRVRCG